MDNSLFRTINRFADRTGWAHGAFKANAGYGIVLFAVLLVIAYLDGRHHADFTAVAGSVWAHSAMATRSETNIVYVPGLVQGIVLVTFPAASTIFTDPNEYDLSSSRYGAMFLPQVIRSSASSSRRSCSDSNLCPYGDDLC